MVELDLKSWVGWWVKRLRTCVKGGVVYVIVVVFKRLRTCLVVFLVVGFFESGLKKG